MILRHFAGVLVFATNSENRCAFSISEIKYHCRSLLWHFETSFTNYKREEPDANRIIVIRLKTLGVYTNIQIGYTYTDLNDYSCFYTLHDIENYYVYDRAKFTYLIDKSKVIFKQRLIDDIDKPFKYISIELSEDHYIDDLSLDALKIFLE